MALASVAASDPTVVRHPAEPAVSWGAIWAGVATSVAVSIFLTLLAAGFGLSLVRQGFQSGVSIASFTPELGCWTIAGQCLAAGIGGYMAGRLRSAWNGVHLDEAHFRDTAHGLVVWAVSTVIGLMVAGLPAAQAAAVEQMLRTGGSTAVDALRASNIAAQASFFMAMGLLLSAFVAAVAARVGGMRSEAMAGAI